MKAIYLSFTFALASSLNIAAQTGDVPKERPRVVTSDPIVATKQIKNTPAPAPMPAAGNDEFRDVSSGRTLSFRDIKSKLAEAKRELQTKPLSTAAVTTPDGKSAEYVRLAFHDWKNSRIDYV